MKPDALAPVLTRYGLPAATVEHNPTGLINQTWLVRNPDGASYVLQRVNAMFGPEIHDDIDAVTTHLAARGLPTPRLVRTPQGELHVREANSLWRLLTHIEGDTHARLDNAAAAESAGRLLGRFHQALADLEYPLQNRRPGVHDTPRHLQHLRDTLQHRREHPRYATVAKLAARILETAAGLPALPVTPERLVHGDPKITNILFRSGTDQAFCMVDFDTLSRMRLPLELGDAFRSWCNPAGEDMRETRFDADIFRAGLRGYVAEAKLLTDGELGAVLDATLTIYVELAARFCADALNEDYFAWDPQRFASHSEHSEVRAAGQLRAAESLRSQPELQRYVEEL